MRRIVAFFFLGRIDRVLWTCCAVGVAINFINTTSEDVQILQEIEQYYATEVSLVELWYTSPFRLFIVGEVIFREIFP